MLYVSAFLSLFRYPGKVDARYSPTGILITPLVSWNSSYTSGFYRIMYFIVRPLEMYMHYWRNKTYCNSYIIQDLVPEELLMESYNAKHIQTLVLVAIKTSVHRPALVLSVAYMLIYWWYTCFSPFIVDRLVFLHYFIAETLPTGSYIDINLM